MSGGLEGMRKGKEGKERKGGNGQKERKKNLGVSCFRASIFTSPFSWT